MAAKNPVLNPAASGSMDESRFQDMVLKFQERIENLQEENSQLLEDQANKTKKIRFFQQEVFDSRQQYSRMENEFFLKATEIEKIQKEMGNLTRVRRDLADRLRKETLQFEKERQEWQDRELELSGQIKRQAFDRRRFTVSGPPKNQAATNERVLDVLAEATGDSGDPLPSSGASSLTDMDRDRQSAIHSRTIRAQDKLVQELRGDVTNLQRGKVQLQEYLDQQALRVLQLENEAGQLRQVNQSLMEDNESYQRLLHEKTMDGSFNLGALGYDHSNSQDGLANLAAELSPTDQGPGSPGLYPQSAGLGMDLAAELDRAFITSPVPDDHHIKQLKQKDDKIDKLKADIKNLEKEVKSHKDESKALSLYINKILSRIMNSGMLQQVLAQDYAGSRSPPTAAGVPADPTPDIPVADHPSGSASAGPGMGRARAVTMADRNTPRNNYLSGDDDDDEDDGLDAMTRAARTAARIRAQKEQRRMSVDQSKLLGTTAGASTTGGPPQLTQRPGRSNTVAGHRPPAIQTQRQEGGGGQGFRSVFSLLSPRAPPPPPSTTGENPPPSPPPPPPKFTHMTPETAAASWGRTIEEDDETDHVATGGAAAERADDVFHSNRHSSTSSSYNRASIQRRATTIMFTSPKPEQAALAAGSNNEGLSEGSFVGGNGHSNGSGEVSDSPRQRQMRRHNSVSTPNQPRIDAIRQGDGGMVGSDNNPDNSSGWKAAWKRMSSASPWKS